jgi:hypothetical protein
VLHKKWIQLGPEDVHLSSQYVWTMTLPHGISSITESFHDDDASGRSSDEDDERYKRDPEP